MVTPNFLFGIPRALDKFCFLRIVLNRAKISLYEKAPPIGNQSILKCAERMRSNNSNEKPISAKGISFTEHWFAKK